MNETTDQELLGSYARNGSEAAFRELVRRHTDLVYSTAARLVVDRHLAEDVSQRVFVALAKNARKLAHRATISGWLHRTTHSFSVMTIRTEERRRLREQKAAPMLSDSPDSNAVWDRVAPYLDDAVSQLDETDRDLMMLRFFQRKTAREIGEQLGLSEEAAQKRVTRALERLRGQLARRGLNVSGAVLAGAISTQAVQAAPAGLAGKLALSCLAAQVAGPVTAGFNPFAFIAQLKSHPIATAIALAACLSLGTGGFVTGRTAASKHWAAMAWREAVLAAPEEPAVANEPVPALAPTGPLAVQELSVAKILAEAAQHFRSVEIDPDATAKGIVALQKLRPEHAAEALRLLESYRREAVFRLMAPHVMKLWAQTEPRAAMEYASNLEYSSNRLENHHARALAQELISRVWARREPEAAWQWYRQTSDSRPPAARGDSSWALLPKPIFTEWAGRDAVGALAEFEKAGSDDERAAIEGIAEATANTQFRPAILSAIGQMKDDEQRRRLAARMSEAWARVDPRSAAEWASGLTFQDPLGRLHVTTEAFEEWWELDRHAAAVWMLTHAPGEMMDQLKGLASPAQIQKLQDAAR
jgi:RNA polymerase sigma factor (sigma-70 family)